MQFKFHAYKELAAADGFNYPVDVHWGTIFLGTLMVLPQGYTIKLIDTPQGKQPILHSKNNEFKSLNIAAEVLHRTWKQYRFGGDEPEGVAVPA
jgi:hypothetical protein